MKLSRTENAIRNMKASFIQRIVNLIGPFILRTVFIYTIGTEYLGLNSLFTSILSMLSLAELGVGSAIGYNLYGAIADNDDMQINALLNFYRKAYWCIGTIILVVGLCMIPFLPKFINGTYPENINLVIVYLLFLLNTVISYFMFAYKESILYAFQRNDVVTIIGVYMSIIKFIIQIVFLVTIKNYYVYLIVIPLFTILSNVKTAISSNKMFPQYRPVGRLSKNTLTDIRTRVGGLIIQKFCQTTRNAFDSIFISMFLGLTQIAIYNNYYFVINSVVAIISIVTSSVLAGVGNSIATETQEKNYRDMMKMNFIYMWICGWCTICLMCLYQNFMKLWVGENFMLPISSVILMSGYFYMLKIGDIRYMYSEACGLWWHNRYRSVIEVIMNVLLNYFLGKYFGINGIIMATLISLFLINFCYGSQIIYRYYFTKYKISSYFLSNAIYALITILACITTYVICSLIPSTIVGMMIKIGVCVVIPNLIYVLIYRNTKMYKTAMPWILERLGINAKDKLWKVLIK